VPEKWGLDPETLGRMAPVCVGNINNVGGGDSRVGGNINNVGGRNNAFQLEEFSYVNPEPPHQRAQGLRLQNVLSAENLNYADHGSIGQEVRH
jgi:hypothetical protein